MRWVTFPTLSVDISTSPSSLNLRPGEQKTILVAVNATGGYEPKVHLNVSSGPGILSHLGSGIIYVKSNSMATVPLQVFASPNATIRPYTLDILSNSTLSPTSFDRINFGYPDLLKHYTLTGLVREPLTLNEQLVLGTIDPQILAGIYGLVAAPLIACLLPRILESFNQRRQRKNLRECIMEVNKLYESLHQNKDTYLDALGTEMKKIEEKYTNGKISESQFRILKDKISE